MTGAVKHSKFIALGIGLAVLITSFFLPEIGGINRIGWSAIAIVIFAIVFWTTEVLPPAATGMAILVLIPTMGVMGYVETFSHMGTVMLWRLMAVFIITSAVQKVGLADRLAYGMLLITKGRVKTMLLCVLLLNFILSFIIPNTMARTTLIITVIAAYLETAKISKDGNIGKAFMIGLPTASNITTCAIMIGASVDIFAAHMFETLIGHTWTYLSWMIVNVPFCLAMTFVIFFVTLIVFPPEQKQLAHNDEELRRKIREFGPIKNREWFVLGVFAFLMVLWFSDLSETIPAEMLAALLLILPHRLQPLQWKEAIAAVKWDILLLFGASIAMAAALQNSGAVAWVADVAFAHLSGIPPVFLVILTVSVTTLVRLGMANMTGAVAILLPLMVSTATGLGINPVWLGMVCVVASTMAFFYPAQNPNTLLSYQYGYFETKHMLKFAAVLFFGFQITFVVIALFYWPLVGVPIWA